MVEQSIFSSRLKVARTMAGLSMQELADKLGITKQAVGKYERGKMQPASTILIKMAQVLDVKVDFFFRQKQVQLQGIEFRKKTRLSKKEQDRITEQATDFLERYLELEALLGVGTGFEWPLRNMLVRTPRDAEQAAGQLREVWELGANPIPNIVEMLEEKGIRIFEVDSSDGFDGLFAWADSIPLIVLNKNIGDIARKRFTAVHELAHPLLPIPEDVGHKEKEQLCHTFAGAFLLPARPFRTLTGAHRSRILDRELILIKEYFGISIRAIMKRAHTLALISDSLYKEECIRMNKMWGGRNEPGNYKGEEKSTRFRQLLYRAVAEGIISVGKAASLGNTTVAEFEHHSEAVG